MHQTHDRFLYNVQLGVWVPKGLGADDAYNVLISRLPRATGWSDVDTPDINGNITVEGMEEIG